MSDRGFVCQLKCPDHVDMEKNGGKAYLTIRVYKAVVFVILGAGGFCRCFSSHSPVMGFWCLKMKWTLLVEPHLSGPNMMVKGV